MKTLLLTLICCTVAGTTVGQMPRKVPSTVPPGVVQTPCKVPATVPPGVIVDVSGQLINAFVEHREQRFEPIRDVILDAPISGISQISGIVRARLVPDAQCAFLDVVFCGSSRTNSVSLHEPVKANTTTLTNFEVHQPITIDARGVYGYCPRAWVRASTSLQGVTSLSGDPDSIVVGFAQVQFRDDKFEIESTIAKHAEMRLVREFGDEVRPYLKDGDKKLREFLSDVDQLGVSMQRQRWWTTTTHLHGEAGRILTAPVSSPPPIGATADLTLRVHQSVLERIAQVNLAGKSYHIFDVANLNDRIVKYLSANPKYKTPPVFDLGAIEQILKLLKLEPVSITFAEKDPISVQIASDGVTVTLHGTRFKQSGTTYPALDIRAKYRLENKDKYITLVRQGSVEILTPASANLPRDGSPSVNQEIGVSGSDAANQLDNNMKFALETNFNLFLPSHAIMPRITLPINDVILLPSRAGLNDGWFVLDWTRSQQPLP